jgi:hypothetical protein
MGSAVKRISLAHHFTSAARFHLCCSGQRQTRGGTAVSDSAHVRVPTQGPQRRPHTACNTIRKENDMAYSSILGADVAPSNPSGREAELLGPSDNSDSGSDTIGTAEADQDTTDSVGTGDRGAVAGPDAREGADILPDRVVNLAEGEGVPEADPDASEMTDLDNDDAQALADSDTSDDDR